MFSEVKIHPAGHLKLIWSNSFKKVVTFFFFNWSRIITLLGFKYRKVLVSAKAQDLFILLFIYSYLPSNSNSEDISFIVLWQFMWSRETSALFSEVKFAHNFFFISYSLQRKAKLLPSCHSVQWLKHFKHSDSHKVPVLQF